MKALSNRRLESSLRVLRKQLLPPSMFGDNRSTIQRDAITASRLEIDLGRMSIEFRQDDCRNDSARLISYERAIVSLGRLLISDKKKESIRKPTFNLFDVLGFPHNRLEQIFSNIMAWLLDPNNPHELGRQFLDLFLGRLFGVTVERGRIRVCRELQEEGHRPDIVVEGYKWKLLIENKIDSMEGPNQSWRYYNHWRRKERGDIKVYFAWLTPQGIQPKCPHFNTISYLELIEILRELTPKGQTSILIQHFNSHIASILKSS